MPSGGHGGRGGGGRSGGGRSGGRSGGFGGSRGGSFRGGRSFGGHGHIHHHHHPHRHIRVRIGGHYYGYSEGGSPLVAILLFFIIFMGIFAVGMGSTRNAIKNEMAYYEEQHIYYQDMIDYAKEHRDEGYIVDAVVTARWYDDDTGKYYLDYEIRTSNMVLDGYTYPCYTLAETTGIVGKTIEVAVDGVPITMTTDSVDLSFENVTLDEDGDYINAKESLKNVTTTFAVTLTITILLIAILVLYSIKKMKKEDDEVTPATSSVETKTESSKAYCSYCGSACPSSATRCPNCGANLR